MEGVGCRGDESTLCIIEGTCGAAASLGIPSLPSRNGKRGLQGVGKMVRVSHYFSLKEVEF